MFIYRLFFTLCLVLLSLQAQAHRSYESYLLLDTSEPAQLVWEIESKNFESLFPLDDSDNGIVSWKELLNHQALLLDYARKHFRLTLDGEPLEWNPGQVVVKRRDDESYLVVPLGLPQAVSPQTLSLQYDLFFEMDEQQRLLFSIKTEFGDHVYLLDAQKTSLNVDINKDVLVTQVLAFALEGGKHLFTGYDHMAFILMLLLALRFDRSARQGMQMRALIQVVSAFTVAHMLTLGLGAAHWVTLPTVWVERVIALTVLIAAVLNLTGREHWLGWRMAFVFGLVHGFGFANVLLIDALTPQAFVVLLLSFNVGLELAQLLFIAAIVPVLIWLQRMPLVHARMMQSCTLLVGGLSVLWLIQRI